MDLLAYSQRVREEIYQAKDRDIIRKLQEHFNFESPLGILGNNTRHHVYRVGSVSIDKNEVWLALRVPTLYFAHELLANQVAYAKELMASINSSGLPFVLEECSSRQDIRRVTTSIGIVVKYDSFIVREGAMTNIPLQGYALLVEDLTHGGKIRYDMSEDGNIRIPVGYKTPVLFDLPDSDVNADARLLHADNMIVIDRLLSLRMDQKKIRIICLSLVLQILQLESLFQFQHQQVSLLNSMSCRSTLPFLASSSGTCIHASAQPSIP
jgi:hypothetical protein